jgi:hypothetical protein
MRRPAVASAILLAAALPAAANDSTARLGAGGIELVRNVEISMEKEVLFLSPDKVTVDYVFRNNAEKDRTLMVAFPMPEIRPIDYLERDVSVPDWESDNFLRFSVTVSGKDIAPALDQRALSYGVDITDELKALGIPLNPLTDSARQAVARLPADKVAALDQRGIVAAEEGSVPRPAWTLRATYYWTQTFPAKNTVDVSHSYTPAVGGFFYYPGEDYTKATDTSYCIDEGTKRAIAKKLKDAQAQMMLARDLSYVLVTAANWAGPIGDFTLKLDKKSPDTLVSLCIDGIEKTGPTTFEARKKDFTPEKDINVLFLEIIKPEP